MDIELPANRRGYIDLCMNGPKKPLREWAVELKLGEMPEHLLAHYYPDDHPVTEWQAKMIAVHWKRAAEPEDPTNVEIEVEITVRAKVKVQGSARWGLREQYPDSYTDRDIWDDEEVAKSLLFAAIDRDIPESITDERYYDGVAKLTGLIRDIELDTR